MARIAGVDLPAHKRVDIALTSIYGIGRTTAVRIIEKSGVGSTKKAGELTGDEVNTIRGLIDYLDYLKVNQQAVERYELALWRKLLAPLTVAVMLLVALS